MTTKFYTNNQLFISGMTQKNSTMPEDNNMALHACENSQMIIKNRENLAASLGVLLTDFICTQQTHSANFRRVAAADKGCGALDWNSAFADTDALYTFDSGIILCSFSADCVPVIVHDKKTGLIGIIHSGWQGTVKEITLKLLQHLIQVEKCNPTDLEIQLGASISQQKFEVDRDVFLRFENLGYADEFMYLNSRTNKYHIDNQEIVKKQCLLAGVSSLQIQMDTTCTFSDISGFSFRENKKCGRHLIFITKKDVNQRLS
ncbi:polyphenol oxidase family protein [Planococcus versutus]|uniref:Laccase n=1 Tax=Planococcus versutus TaxID=1302659 RepID=A0A1B1RX18_9BACL|nr:polyphenol oxidase family protein [Planococcus versutus]ANU25482.1 laccase [Planococcus versutus]